MKKGVKPCAERKLGEERRIMQARFDEFKIRITLQLKGIQASDLAGEQAELTEIQKLVKELHERPIHSMLIIEEISREPMVKIIWMVDDLTHVGNF